jgi:hypothetical protein
MSEIERQRDAALIGYNECRATIEDAKRALGATAHEGLLLAAMRVKEQRDNLVDALELLLDGLLTYAPDYMHGLPKRHYIDEAMEALAAAKGDPQ